MQTPSTPAPRAVPHVVVIGGGFAGLAATRALRTAPVTVTLVDRANHHLFQPLLYQVATASLAPSDIAVPIRHVLRDQLNATVLLGDVRDVDLAGHRVRLGDGAGGGADRGERTELAYDYLVVATGSRHAYFGHDAWASDAPGLKTLADAVEIRRRLLGAFEHAERATTAADAAAHLTFVIVGGGPTGVELAGMIPELARGALGRDFRRIDPRHARVLLVEAGPRLLPALPASLGARARRDLLASGVDVRLDTHVDDVTSHDVRLRTAGVDQHIDERVATSTVLWAAGNRASPLGASLARQAGVDPDRAGRMPVAADLSLAGHPEVFVAGDLALVAWERHGGRGPGVVPSVAPAAMQAGRRAGDNVARLARGRPTRPFAYVDKGELATIGRHRAVASFLGGRLRVAGWMAWWFWLGLHIAYLIGFRSRLSVLLQWSYAYLFGDRGARLIIAPDMPNEPVAEATRRPAA